MNSLISAPSQVARSSRWFRRLGLSVGLLGLGYAALLVTDGAPPGPAGAGRPVFTWWLDSFWSELEREMVAARRLERGTRTERIDAAIAGLNQLLVQIAAQPRAAGDALFSQLETDLFRLAPLIVAQPERMADYVAVIARLRHEVKVQSQVWDLNAAPVRSRLYRLLFGARMVLEQVLLQVPPEGPFPALVRGEDEPAATAATTLLGVKVHSGDILVSRGGAPTSALIARGNDYPGMFSHVALVHVDPETKRAVTIESHIERGVVVAPLEAYLQDRKLRVLILRPRADLESLRADPLLPHRAASHAVAEAARRHIPYDFAMNVQDASAQFCSEVASVAYAAVGLKLWMGVSYLSSPTVTAWLGSIGVRHFETQEPADLEYDAQLRIVAEWREPATLFKAHVDDAVTEVMFEVAPSGEPLPYNCWLLPPARLAKAYSVLLNAFGRVGPIPEGMSATAALRVDRYQAAHRALVGQVQILAEQFRQERGYAPPFWQLVELARRAERERGGR